MHACLETRLYLLQFRRALNWATIYLLEGVAMAPGRDPIGSVMLTSRTSFLPSK
jgi:hypothetical protein